MPRLAQTGTTTGQLAERDINDRTMRGLYAITPELLDSSRLIEQVRHAINGGANIVQYRSKRASPGVNRQQAELLYTLTRETGTTFIVNDNVDLALSVGADGVHIGRDDGDVESISRIREQCVKRTSPLSGSFMIGVSCYNELPRAERAVAAGADYIAFGSFFSSSTKPFAAKADASLIRAAKARFEVPIVAIGGISVENASELVLAGVDAVAVIASLFDADDIEQRAREFTNLFKLESHVQQ